MSTPPNANRWRPNRPTTAARSQILPATGVISLSNSVVEEAAVLRRDCSDAVDISARQRRSARRRPRRCLNPTLAEECLQAGGTRELGSRLRTARIPKPVVCPVRHVHNIAGLHGRADLIGETLANLPITGHSRCFSNQPVAEIVQCGEPIQRGPFRSHRFQEADQLLTHDLWLVQLRPRR